MLDMILAGLSEALQLANLLFVLLGVIAGMIAGAIPGVNGPMAIALCIPLSYYMSPVAAIGFLVGLNKGAFFGGSISGVLLNTPGTPESAATTWDGYPLAKQGKGEKALRMALYASVTGDAFATLVLILVAAPLAAVALYMGPPEIFALICMAMTIIAGLGTRSLLRGFIAAALGVLLGTVGIEPVSALPRLPFDIVPLERGISLIPVGIGMLAFSEIIIQLEQQLGRKEAREVITFSSKPEDRFITLKEYVECLNPLMFEQNAQFIYAIYGSLIIANLFLLGVGRLGLRLFCKVVQIPSVILYPIIIFTCVMGAYLAQYAVFDVTLMLCFSLLAYFMRKFDYSFICLIIGFILAPIWETSLQQVIIASEQDPYMFLTRPVAVVLMLMTFFIIGKSVLATGRKK